MFISWRNLCLENVYLTCERGNYTSVVPNRLISSVCASCLQSKIINDHLLVHGNILSISAREGAPCLVTAISTVHVSITELGHVDTRVVPTHPLQLTVTRATRAIVQLLGTSITATVANLGQTFR